METIKVNYICTILTFISFYTYYSCHINVSMRCVLMDTEMSLREEIFVLS